MSKKVKESTIVIGLLAKAWLLGKCTYEKLSDMIAIYYVDGLSFKDLF